MSSRKQTQQPPAIRQREIPLIPHMDRAGQPVRHLVPGAEQLPLLPGQIAFEHQALNRALPR